MTVNLTTYGYYENNIRSSGGYLTNGNWKEA
jgi:hypothetical protein